MNKVFLIETMLNSRNKSNKMNKENREINRMKKRLSVIRNKTQSVKENDSKRALIRNDFLNLVMDMNDYFVNNKCN